MIFPVRETVIRDTLPRRLFCLFSCMSAIGCSDPSAVQPVLPFAADSGGSKESIENAMLSDKAEVTDRNSFVETFDRVLAMSDTCFSEVHLVGSGRFEIDSISEVPGAPGGELLPVSDDGDKEVRYYEGDGGIAGSHSMAVAPSTSGYFDSCVSGFLGASLTDVVFGSRTAGLMCRASGDGWAQSAYVAKVSFGSAKNEKVSFQLSLMKKGVIHADNVADRSGSFPFNFATENIYVELRSIGDQISASFWRVDGSGEKELLSKLSIEDGTLRSGGIGIYAFSRGDKSVFFDDIEIEKISEAR